MSYRFGYFKDELKKPYFESTQTLADVFGVHRNTVSKAIQTLKALGYIDITTKRGGSNTYTNVTTWLNGAAPAGSDAQKKQLPKAQGIRPRQVVENKPTPQVAKNWYDDDDDLVPF
jgi:DNA-binding transcriptional MocR family regulator